MDNRCKLTEEQVREIRKAYASGETQASIAGRYGVTTQNIGRIIRNEVWRHVRMEAETRVTQHVETR